jgi:DNA-binding transcriptional ArsR family regulator
VTRRKLLVYDDHDGERRAKTVLVADGLDSFQSAYGDVGQAILTHLARRSDYPSNIARTLNRSHQAVYYHIHRLERDGLIARSTKQNIRGGRANLYSLASDGFAVEYDVQGDAVPTLASALRSRSLGAFLKEYVQGGAFDGWIVVGSPEPHGPNRTQGRDGHYAVQLGFALGQFVGLPSKFPVRLDVDIKSEKLLSSNLIVVGGPRTNVIAAELNKYLPVRFSEDNFWGSIVDSSGKTYFSQMHAIIAKIPNPWDESKRCVVVAGLTGAGTKAAVIGLTNLSELVLEKYDGGKFGVVLSGVDLDGDGKVDSVEVLQRS